jgi:hypothetical protein
MSGETRLPNFYFSLAKVAKAAAIVANDCGVTNVGKSAENLAKPGA